MSLSDGRCIHGLPLDEPCLLCVSDDGPARDVHLPTTFDEDVAVLVRTLESWSEWVTSDALIPWIAARVGEDVKRFSKTYLRHLAKGSRGLVISGQRGYKATKKATRGEVQDAASGLIKAARGCMERRSDILFAFHHGRAPTEQERKTKDGESKKTKTTPGHEVRSDHGDDQSKGAGAPE